MFRALRAHPQDSLAQGHLVYCVRAIAVEFHCNPDAANGHNTHAIYKVMLV
jgi:hypothetical protein